MQTPRGYILAEITVANPTAYEIYRDAVAPLIARMGGKYLVRGGKTETLEGGSANRLVVLEFDSVAAARAFYDSTEYQAIIRHRTSNAEPRLILVEGVTPTTI